MTKKKSKVLRKTQFGKAKKQKLGPLQLKWVKALESGRYKQTTGRLEDSVGRNCCLGVACRVARLKKTAADGDVAYVGTSALGDVCEVTDNLPHNLVLDFGFHSDSGQLKEPWIITRDNEQEEINNLISANDDAGRTFKDIAGFCRANPESVFKEPK